MVGDQPLKNEGWVHGSWDEGLRGPENAEGVKDDGKRKLYSLSRLE